MKRRRPFLSVAGLLAVTLLLCGGCRSVETGPGMPPDPDAQSIIYGQEPKPEKIPQKDVPPGESSLSRRTPDQRIDQP